MQLFYTPDISGETYVLSEDESRHCARVLRLAAGDIVYLTDGRGTLCEARITDPSPKHCEVEIISRTANYGKRPYELVMAVAPTKNPERYEWFLEKAVEIGVDAIIPMETARSERRALKAGRCEKIVVSAIKQSLKAYLPEFSEITHFENVVKMPFDGDKFIAHCNPGSGKILLRDAIKKNRNTMIMIGPEGDFSPEEVATALANGFREVSLGDARLRTETAAIVACLTAALINQ